MAEPSVTDPIVGIDLGTTNSLVAWADPGHGLSPRVLTGPEGRGLLPSVVRYGAGGRVEAVGDGAREHAAEFPGRTISSIKRLMGRSRADAAADLPYLSYEVIEGANATARVQLPGAAGGGVVSPHVVSPQEVSAVILRELKARAEAALGTVVTRAVVTVPAYFDDAQRQATRDAGRLAGLNVVRIVNEPTAAALAYGIGVLEKRAETIAVFDLGGGTFDVSILSLVPGEGGAGSEGGASGGGDAGSQAWGADFFQVLSTAGDTHLGGDDVDQLIVQRWAAELGKAWEDAAALAPADVQRLRREAERLKIALSDRETSHAEVEIAGRATRLELSRADLEQLIGPWVERAIRACERAVGDAGLTPGQIDRVVMVGGSTRMPLVRRRVAEFFGREPYSALNPDEVVALGAAVQGSIMAGLRTDALLLDVIPLSLGIETAGGAMAKLIVRNSTVPARATEHFSTSVDGQTSIKIHVLQGEREMAADSRSLGVFHLRGLPPMPAGIPRVEVEFLVDAGGVLSVAATETRSGTRASIQIVPHHGLTRDEVDRLEAESLLHAREDMTRHRVVDLAENSALDVKWIGDRLAKVGGDLEPAYRAELEASVQTLARMVEQARERWQSVNPDEFYKAKESLDRLSMRLHEVSITQSLRGTVKGD